MSIDLSEAAEEEVLITRRFEKVEGTSCKFYEIQIVRTKNPGENKVVWNVESRYGSMKTGAHVTTKAKEFGTVYSAEDEVTRTARTRYDHGYREVK